MSRARPTARRGRSTGGVVFLTGVVCGLLVAALVELWLPRAEGADLRHYRAVRDFVRTDFVREVEPAALLDDALHGMLAGLDEYSRYYDRAEAAELERGTEGRFRGIGVVFSEGRTGEEHRVLFALEGSPAAAAGLDVGDLVVSIDDTPVAPMTSDERARALGDPARERLEILVEDLDGLRRTVVVRRDSIVDPTVRHARVVDAERGIGYAAILGFSHETATELDRAVARLRERGARALVLDLRGNRGGVLEAAVAVAQRFLREGRIVSIEGRGEPLVHRADPARATLAGTPLVVLVDGETASASEVLAAALGEHRVAALVGEPTYGKGLVQTIRRFPERGAIAKVTSAYYYTPSHRNLERTLDPGRDWGVLPDLEVSLAPAERRALRRWAASYDPPESALPALRAWEERDGLDLVDEPPPDPQLDAAVELLRGGRPEGYFVPRTDGDR